MTDMQRYSWRSFGLEPSDDGEWVLASDAEAAIAAAEQRGMRQAHDSVPALQQYGIEKYHEGQRDAIAAAVQRVEAQPVATRDGYWVYIRRNEVIAALRALGDSDA